MAYPVYPGNVTFPSDSFLPTSTGEWTAAELSAFIIGVVLQGISAVMTAYLNFYRHVPYVKILGIGYFNVLSVCCVILWFGCLAAGHVMPRSGAFLVCSLWGYWFFVLGIASVALVYIERLWRLDLIIVQRKSARRFRLHSLPGFAFLVGVAISAAGTAMGADGPYIFPTVGQYEDVVMCYQSDTFTYLIMVYIVLLAVTYITLAIRLRGSRVRIYLEYTQSLISFSFVIISVIVYMAIEAGNYHFMAWGRTIIIYVITFLVVAMQWVFYLPLLHKLLFRHEQALVEFKAVLANKPIIVDSATLPPSGTSGSNPRTAAVRTLFMRLFVASSQGGRTASDDLTGAGTSELGIHAKKASAASLNADEVIGSLTHLSTYDSPSTVAVKTIGSKDSLPETQLTRDKAISARTPALSWATETDGEVDQDDVLTHRDSNV